MLRPHVRLNRLVRLGGRAHVLTGTRRLHEHNATRRVGWLCTDTSWHQYAAWSWRCRADPGQLDPGTFSSYNPAPRQNLGGDCEIYCVACDRNRIERFLPAVLFAP
ncbi:hypothetical protein YTPLAS18_28490 [Nitrospira sp.]|nr:hypothetical protein YTPLAS18_28490 [Nitrospira sp.]